jgi:hypothetical protein
MVHVFGEHLLPVEESAGNKKNRRAQRFGALVLVESPVGDGMWLQTWSPTTIGDDRDLKILGQANNVFSEILAA